MDKIDQVILDANFKCSITIVIKIFKKEAPYLKFPSELLRYCADHSIDINFDLIIY